MKLPHLSNWSHSSHRSYLSHSLASAALLSCAIHANVITDWNLITVSATKTAGLNSNLGSRIDAIEAVAVYDAVNAVLRAGSPYHYATPATLPALPEAAAAQAAYDVLVASFPSQKTALDSSLSASLSSLPDGAAKDNGRTAGSAAAADILALRASDGSSPNFTYAGPANPGVGDWRPTPGATAGTFPPGINEQWGSVTPFLLPSANVFRPQPPPPPGSDAYQQALAEVQAIGSITNLVRTTDQTHVADFYKQDAELTVNETARQLALAHGLTVGESALLFALVDVAVADARIAIWDAKYTFRFWRPITALNANPDGSVTNNYSAWQPLIVTPSHPSYPSGHSGTVNAGFEVLKDFFGNRQTVYLHTTTSGEPPRLIQSLSQGESENGLSRIYGGIHFNFDNIQGQSVGNQVAAYVLAHGPHFLRSTATDSATLGVQLYPGIRLNGLFGHSYRIDYADNLTPTNWNFLRYVTAPTSAASLFFDPQSPGSTNRFYRAVEVSN